MIPSSNIDRLPPHDIEAEQGVLGCILLNPAMCVPLCVEQFGTGEVFYDLRHQTIYAAAVTVFDRLNGVDSITLGADLKGRNLLEQVGGVGYLSRLPDMVPTAFRINDYIFIVRQKFLLRGMIRACTNAVGTCYEGLGEAETVLDAVEKDVLAVRQSVSTGNETKTARSLVGGAVDKIEAMNQNRGMLTGLATGFPDFDRLTLGLQAGEMIVIAARPSLGKTSIGMNIAEHVAVDLQMPVGVFSLEMTAEALMLRMVSSRSRVSLRRVQAEGLYESDYPRITSATGKLHKAPLFIDDSSGLSIIRLRAKARRMFQLHGIKLFVVDYLQLLNASGGSKRHDSRQAEVTEISSGLKELAKELKVPVLVLSQLNRELEKEKNRKPRLSDIRESGSVEQDGDLIGLLYRPKRDEPEDDDAEAVPVNLLIAKQRNGPAGVDVRFTFLKHLTRFESAARISNEDIPDQRSTHADP